MLFIIKDRHIKIRGCSGHHFLDVRLDLSSALNINTSRSARSRFLRGIIESTQIRKKAYYGGESFYGRKGIEFHNIELGVLKQVQKP
jgi:hypothetical protein